VNPRRFVGRVHTRALVSRALVVFGALLLVVSASSIARGALARDAARARWAELDAQRSVSAGRIATGNGARWTATRGSPVARLSIPRIALDEVVVEGVEDAELRAGPGHMIGSAFPGDSGTSVISAHRDRHFHSLGRVVVGDTIVTENELGTTTWSVTRLRVVGADDPVLRSTPTPTLVLTTCWPIRYFGPAPDRLIVEAKPILDGNGNRQRGTGNRAALPGA
jgi:LPXTG-site transpeptidase (sortase) family protein